MTDPYTSLGDELAAAAARQASTHGGLRAWLSRRLNASSAASAVVVALAGAAVAVAATGVLSGAPVKPEVTPSAVAGNGLPIEGDAQRIALRAADPDGGLPWGMRVLHTTRGQVCAQVGRVQDGRLGELGLDSAFSDDGRFHALSPEILPPGYGGAQGDVECALAGDTMIFENTAADRSGVRLLPEELGGPRGKHGTVPPVANLRTLVFGVLGPHAVSVTYRTPAGLRTKRLGRGDGAFLIVGPAGRVSTLTNIGGSVTGQATRKSVSVLAPTSGRAGAVVTAATFDFDGRVCSQGTGAPVHRRCPTHLLRPRANPVSPAPSLHHRVQLTLLPQSQAACKRAFLLYPCYKGRIEFVAPYAVTTAATDYLVTSYAKCKAGGRPETSWSLERDVKRHETVRTESLGLFVFTPACAADERFEVRYVDGRGPVSRSAPESVILGSVALSEAKLPDGAHVTSAAAPASSG